MSKLHLNDVSFSYENSAEPKKILEDISFTVEPGTFVSILGKSGCGKTTLLRLMAGLCLPQCGQVLINDSPVLNPSVHTAMVFQNYPLFPWMKVIENVVFGIRQSDKTKTKKEAREIAEQILMQVEMQDAMELYPCQLSGGMQQRTALARALAMNAHLLLLDEPFGALDPQTKQKLYLLLEKICLQKKQNLSVVMVTHDPKEALLLSDQILVMASGKISECIHVDFPHPRCQSPDFTEMSSDKFRFMLSHINKILAGNL